MSKRMFPRAVICIFAGWSFWVVGNLMVPTTGKSWVVSQAYGAPEPRADGLEVYRQFCVNCHGANGKGDENMKKVMTMIPDFTSEKWQKENSDAQITVDITDGKGTLMPAFADKVTADQVPTLMEYIRKFDPSRAK
jgi:mono/diheme cytochrome c family protein